MMANSWARQPKEGVKAYAAFCVYRDIGTTRTIDAACSAGGKQQTSNKRASGLWTNWATVYKWVERAAAYDAHVESVAMAAADRAAAHRADKVERMRLEQVDFELADGITLREKGLILVALGHLRRKTEPNAEGVEVTVIMPAHAQEFRAGADMVIRSHDLSRRALGMPTKFERVEATELDAAIEQELARLSGGSKAADVETFEGDDDTEQPADIDTTE